MVRWKQILKLISLGLLTTMAMPAIAFAAQSNSSSYQINEVFFGAGGELHACSTTYCSKQSAGELAVGHICSNGAYGYCAEAGFNTDRYPYLEFKVNGANINLGSLSSTSTKTANSVFSVKAYLAHGYSVINASDPPRNNAHVMTTLTSPAASLVGNEQFGLNLVANTSPTTFGADPVQVPDNTFAVGQVASDYSQTNFYKYLKGDTVALSTASTSETDYTISYIFNITNVTPGGTYDFNHVLVATATY